MKKLVLCALGVLVSSAVNGQQATQWSGNNHWYQVVKVPSGISWENARERAVAMGGYLATPSSSAENEFIKGLLAADGQAWSVKGIGPWIGGYQNQALETLGGEGQHWSWLSGENFSDTDWKGGQPDNGFMGESEGHLHYLADDTSHTATIGWNDASSEPEKYSPVAFVVEYETDPEFQNQSDWQDVPLSDTDYFDIRCEYRVFQDETTWVQNPVYTGKEKLLFDVSTQNLFFGVINYNNKAVERYVVEGNVDAAQTSSWNIFKIQKRC